MSVIVKELYRYPVKGLSGEALSAADLQAGATLPDDRRFAIAHGTTQFDSGAPAWQPKTNFLMLMKNEKLAQLRVNFAPETGDLTISRDGKQVLKARITEPLGRTLAGQFFASFLSGETRGLPKLIEAPGHSFSDVPEKVLSFINLASVTDLERVVRQPINPLRFRGNVYLEGLEPWRELAWPDQELTVGTARLKVLGPIGRCAATNVDPETAARDLNIPMALKRGFGHVEMGVYATVVDGGRLAVGDQLTVGG